MPKNKCKCQDPTKDFKRRASAAAGWTDIEVRIKAVLHEIRKAYRLGKQSTQHEVQPNKEK